MRRKEGESLLLFCVPFFDIASAEERQGGKERGHAHTHRVSDGEHDGVEESKTSLVLGCEVLEGDVQGTSLLVIAVAHFFFLVVNPFFLFTFFSRPPSSTPHARPLRGVENVPTAQATSEIPPLLFAASRYTTRTTRLLALDTRLRITPLCSDADERSGESVGEFYHPSSRKPAEGA